MYNFCFFFNTKRGEYSSISIFITLAQRYKAIMTPLAPRQSHGTLWTAIALIWFVVVSFPAGFKHPNNEQQCNVPGLEELLLLSPLLSTQRSIHLLVGNKKSYNLIKNLCRPRFWNLRSSILKDIVTRSPGMKP